jgi:hypothetical protein
MWVPRCGPGVHTPGRLVVTRVRRVRRSAIVSSTSYSGRNHEINGHRGTGGRDRAGHPRNDTPRRAAIGYRARAPWLTTLAPATRTAVSANATG